MKNINHLKILRHTDGFLVNLKYNCRLRTVELKLSKILLPASNYFYYIRLDACACVCKKAILKNLINVLLRPNYRSRKLTWDEMITLKINIDKDFIKQTGTKHTYKCSTTKKHGNWIFFHIRILNVHSCSLLRNK